ncbi:diguanylate cyclase [bacterium]|nr:diguanylate cyclase [bacterium]MBU1983883.1 diguanylate cyclase [bacterium]
MQNNSHWSRECAVAITVCDAEGIIIEMNDRAAEVFAKDGGTKLIGTNVLDCHPEPSRSLLVELMANQRTHAYTIEKNGVKKLIYQTPWFENGQFGGLVEFSMEIPYEMPHFVRGT